MGDIHLRASDIEVGGPVFLKACQSAQNNECDILIVGGDLFDSTLIGGRGASTGSVVAWAKRGLSAFKGKKYILLGNHELAGVGQAHALEVLRDLPDVEIIDRDTVLENVEAKIAFLPYINPAHLFARYPVLSREELREKFAHALDAVLQKLTNAEPHIIVGHCAVTGSIANKSGYRVFGNGNTMELMASQVLSVAPKVAWFDFHKRQAFSPDRPNDGYVGALRQLNFGEECNPTGYRLIDIETGEDRFIEIESPRYYTVSSEEYAAKAEQFAKLAAEGHFIKVRGDEIPTTGFFEELPKGVRFERTAPQDIIQRRSDENFVSDESPVNLLAKWYRHAAPEVSLEQLTEAYDKIAGGLELKTNGIGSLIRVRRIKLQNIAKHADTEVLLDGLDGVICIDGDNGAGKTTLIESLMLAIYGEAPSYSQDLYGMISQGHIGDALIEVEIEAETGIFVFQRCAHITPKTKSQDFTVLEVIDGSLKPVAGGPKRQAEGEAFAQALIGDKSLIMASVFAAQKAKDLIDYTPAERKDLLSMLLGSERFVPIAEAAKAKANEVSKLVTEREASIRTLSANIAPTKDIEDEIAQHDDHKAENEARIKAIEKEIDQLIERKASMSANSQYTTLKAQLDSLSSEITECTCKVSEYNIKLDAIKRHEADYQAKAKALEGTEGIQLKLNDARYHVEQLEKKADAARANREQVQNEIVKLQEQKSKAEREFFTAYAAWQNRLDSAKRELEKKVADLERKRDRWTDELHNANNKAELLKSDSIGCKGEMECVFLKDAKEAAANVAIINDRLDDVSQDLDCRDYWDEYKAVVSIEDEEPTKPDLAAIEAKISELRGSLPLVPAIDRSEVLRLEKMVAEVTAIQNEMSVLVGKIAVKDEILASKESLSEKQMVKQREMNDIKAKLQGLTDPSRAIAEIEHEISAKKNDIASIRVCINDATSKIGRAQERIDRINADKKRIESLNDEITDLKVQGNIYLTLARAFGRDGIPQLILDTAIPRLAELSSQLLNAADYEGKLLFRTQGVTQKGAVREVLDILAWDGETGDYRDVSQFSGGEGTILRLAIRLAFGLLQAERAGKQIRVFVADESFQALKPHRALSALAMFEALRSRFQQIFVISHHSEVTAAILQKVMVVKDGGVSRVEVLHG